MATGARVVVNPVDARRSVAARRCHAVVDVCLAGDTWRQRQETENVNDTDAAIWTVRLDVAVLSSCTSGAALFCTLSFANLRNSRVTIPVLQFPCNNGVRPSYENLLTWELRKFANRSVREYAPYFQRWFSIQDSLRSETAYHPRLPNQNAEA